jgi:single-strand DNA-binding protein
MSTSGLRGANRRSATSLLPWKSNYRAVAEEPVVASFNKVILLGNLTRDPQVRYTPSGTAVTDIGLAVNRVWTDRQTNTRNEETTFVDVTLWGRQAEVAGEYLSKGRAVLIEGRLHLDQWEDRESGQKRSKLKVVCEQMTMVGGKSDGPSRGSGGGRSQGQQSYSQDEPSYEEPPGRDFEPPPPAANDDVPF